MNAEQKMRQRLKDFGKWYAVEDELLQLKSMRSLPNYPPHIMELDAELNRNLRHKLNFQVGQWYAVEDQLLQLKSIRRSPANYPPHMMLNFGDIKVQVFIPKEDIHYLIFRDGWRSLKAGLVHVKSCHCSQ